MKDLDAKLETVNALHRETLEAMTDEVAAAWGKQNQIASVCDRLRRDAKAAQDTTMPPECAPTVDPENALEAADIIERLALWEDMGPRQADAIVRLTDEINHLEQNFTEWLKEYRKLSERVVELERTLALSGREG